MIANIFVCGFILSHSSGVGFITVDASGACRAKL